MKQLQEGAAGTAASPTKGCAALAKLIGIQLELKAPKSQYNSFGKYNYRNTEDIMEALKPLLARHGMCLTLRDEIIPVMDRIYVKATAILFDIESGEWVDVAAWAREEENNKGMDGSQVTGAASSYARKYALNAMFLIDDSKDSDFTNTGDKEESTRKASPAPQSNDTAKPSIMDSAVEYIKKAGNKQVAYDQIIAKYGESLTQPQQAALKKFVR
jgi:hypothetical protein